MGMLAPYPEGSNVRPGSAGAGESQLILAKLGWATRLGSPGPVGAILKKQGRPNRRAAFRTRRTICYQGRNQADSFDRVAKAIHDDLERWYRKTLSLR
jgi:hypothetical protein